MADREKIRAEIIRRIEEEQRIRREKEKLTGVGSIIDTRYESLLSFIDSMQEETTIPDIVDKHWWEMLGEEPVSEDMEKAVNDAMPHRYCWSGDGEPVYTKEQMKEFFKAGAKWQFSQLEKNRLAACDAQTEEEVEIERDFVIGIIEKEHRQPTFDDAIKYGMRLQKKQMMKDATGAIVAVDAGGYPYVDKHIELYDYDKDIPLAKEGDKYKVILIKED